MVHSGVSHSLPESLPERERELVHMGVCVHMNKHRQMVERMCASVCAQKTASQLTKGDREKAVFLVPAAGSQIRAVVGRAQEP